MIRSQNIEMSMSIFQLSMSKFQKFPVSEFQSQCQMSKFQKAQCQMANFELSWPKKIELQTQFVREHMNGHPW